MPVATPTARQKLQASQLATPTQMELLGGDVNLAVFKATMRGVGGLELESAITDAVVDRVIDGASTLTVTVNDDAERTIQRSGRLGRKVDVKVDGLWWTLVAVKKTGNNVQLVFEEREVNLLRYYSKFIYASRDQVTRAQFVLRMIKEVKEVPLKWMIPELGIKQPILGNVPGPNQTLIDASFLPVAGANKDPSQDAIARQKGLIHDGTLTVKNQPATAEQIKNGEIVLQTAEGMKAPDKVLVASITTGITESTLHNYVKAVDHDSLGVFQQRPSQGWPASGDVAIDTAAFVKRAISANALNPGLTVAQLCQAVQGSAYSDGRNYAPWEQEARVWVDAFHGLTGGVPLSGTPSANTQASQGQNYFTRGTIQQAGTGQFLLTKENSWNAINRLAREVQWKAFCVSGIIYFISERWLFQSKPFMVINEETDGVDWIDYDFDEGKKAGTVTVTAHLSRWSAPPGSIVRIRDQASYIDGNWLVEEITRSLYDTVATITLRKPEPVLPEPISISGFPKGLNPPVSGPSGKTPEISVTQGNDIQKKVVAFAQSQLGVPYSWGGGTLTGPSLGFGRGANTVGFDCSGLTQAAYNSAGLSIPDVAETQYHFGRILSKVEVLQPGDLVFFGTSSNIHHVGIYIGNGNMIDAPHTGSFVKVDKDFQNTWPDYYGATRPWQR